MIAIENFYEAHSEYHYYLNHFNVVSFIIAH